MNVVSLIIQLLAGAAGGNIAGRVLKERSLGTLGNSIAGIVGGGIGSWLLHAVGLLSGGGETGLATILADVASGGAGGALLMIVIGLVRGASTRTAN